jgi:GntR family transcriptional regulator
MVIKQVDYDAAETPVSYSVEYHLASAFDFRLLRQGPAPKMRAVSNDRL